MKILLIWLLNVIKVFLGYTLLSVGIIAIIYFTYSMLIVPFLLEPSLKVTFNLIDSISKEGVFVIKSLLVIVLYIPASIYFGINVLIKDIDVSKRNKKKINYLWIILCITIIPFLVLL
jgi:hypothetical protein